MVGCNELCRVRTVGKHEDRKIPKPVTQRNARYNEEPCSLIMNASVSKDFIDSSTAFVGLSLLKSRYS